MNLAQWSAQDYDFDIRSESLQDLPLFDEMGDADTYLYHVAERYHGLQLEVVAYWRTAKGQCFRRIVEIAHQPVSPDSSDWVQKIQADSLEEVQWKLLKRLIQAARKVRMGECTDGHVFSEGELRCVFQQEGVRGEFDSWHECTHDGPFWRMFRRALTNRPWWKWWQDWL